MGRILSLCVATVYLIAAIFVFGASTYEMLELALFLFVPLALIWFGDAIGSFTVPSALGMQFLNLNKETPGFLVKLMGWFFLSFPLLIIALAFLVSTR